MKEKNKRGRPTKYKEEYSKQVYKLCLLGMTDAELAKFFEVNIDTITEWKKVHEDFSVSIREGREIADADVATKLFKRALGYEYEETSTKSRGDNEGDEETTVHQKHMPADVRAMRIWLNNRQRHRWKQNPDNFNQEGERTGFDVIGFIPTGVKPIESESEIKDHLDDVDK